MNKYFILFFLPFIIGCGTTTVIKNTMQLSSTAFEHNGIIPLQYTCDGEDVNPPLIFSDIPDGTQSLTLIMDDPDAVKSVGRVWDHWIVWNISPRVTNIEQGKEPEGTHGTGTSGQRGYYPPCPPDGEHGYHFKLYALDTRISLPMGANKGAVENAMKGHILAEAELVGRYVRK